MNSITFISGVPQNGDLMRKILSDGRVRVDVAYRSNNGMPTHIQATVPASMADTTEQALRNRSLKFRDLIDLSLKENNGAGKLDLYNRIKKDLGELIVDAEGTFADAVEDYMQGKEDTGLAENTLANYAGVIMRVLRRAKKKRAYRFIELPDLEYDRKFRDRVRTPEEITAMDSFMDSIHSHLKPSIKLAEHNPIRGRSDLWVLERKNLVISSQYPAYIEFVATKTRNKKPQKTYLVELSDYDLEYFDWVMHTFPDCPFLYPGFYQDRFGKWTWWKMGNPRRHFDYICKHAGVEDFHFHDLKHEAISYMLHVRDSQGNHKYTVQDLKDLGIQYSDKAIKIYLNLSAKSVLERLNCYSNSIESKVQNA